MGRRDARCAAADRDRRRRPRRRRPCSRSRVGPGGPSRRPGRCAGRRRLAWSRLLGRRAACSADDDDDSETAAEEERDNQDRIDLDKPLTSTTERRHHHHPPHHDDDPPGRPALRRARGGRAARLQRRAAGSWSTSTPGAHATSPCPRTIPYDAVAVTGGCRDAVTGDGETRLLPVLGAGRIPSPWCSGRGDQVLPGGRPDRVWLIDGGGRRAIEGAPPARRRAAGRPRRAACCARSRSPGAACRTPTDDAVLVSTGRPRLRGRRGRASDPSPSGGPSGAIGDAAGRPDAATTTATCALRAPADGRSRGRRRCSTVADPDGSGYEAVVGAGRPTRAARATDRVGWPDAAPAVRRRRAAAGTSRRALDSFSAPPRWLPDDLGLVVRRRPGLRVDPVGRAASGRRAVPVLERPLDRRSRSSSRRRRGRTLPLAVPRERVDERRAPSGRRRPGATALTWSRSVVQRRAAPTGRAARRRPRPAGPTPGRGGRPPPPRPRRGGWRAPARRRPATRSRRPVMIRSPIRPCTVSRPPSNEPASPVGNQPVGVLRVGAVAVGAQQHRAPHVDLAVDVDPELHAVERDRRRRRCRCRSRSGRRWR